MTNLNDFGVNYLCQSLPFGGVNASGFDRFAGIEGIRGCCNMRAVTSDKVTGVRTNIPPSLQYPIAVRPSHCRQCTPLARALPLVVCALLFACTKRLQRRPLLAASAAVPAPRSPCACPPTTRLFAPACLLPPHSAFCAADPAPGSSLLLQGAGFDFVASLMNMFYGDGLLASAMGVATLIKASVAKKPSPKSD